MQRLPRMRSHRRGRLRQHLGLDGPDHQRGLRQRGPRRFGVWQRSHAQPLAQSLRLGRLRLNHGDVRRRRALAQQPARNGAGHVAAADKNNGRKGKAHETS